jgi:drug/metabolite transporter (DMT)-like permease
MLTRLGGIGFIVVALACFGALDTTSKVAAGAVPVVMALWVRYVVQTFFTVAVLWPRQRAALLRTRRPLAQVVRALLLITGNAIAFVSLAHMHVGEFTAIAMLTPLVLTVSAALALHERVSGLRWLCVAAGFVGTLVVIRPGAELFRWATLLPLLLVLSNTAFQVATSSLTKIDSPGTIHFYSGLTGLVLTTLALPLFWQAQPLSLWLVMGLMGVFGALGHFLLIMAYSRAPVVELTPYLYLQIGFGAVGGWLVFGHVPDAPSLAGIALISAGGVFGTWLSARDAMRIAGPRAAETTNAAIAGADSR